MGKQGVDTEMVEMSGKKYDLKTHLTSDEQLDTIEEDKVISYKDMNYMLYLTITIALYIC